MQSTAPSTVGYSQSCFAPNQCYRDKLGQLHSVPAERINYSGHHLAHAGPHYQLYASASDTQPPLQALHFEIALVPASWQHQLVVAAPPQSPETEHDHVSMDSQEDADEQENAEL